MSQTTTSPGPTALEFVHLELVHHNPVAAYEFLRDSLGAERVEKEIADYISNTFGVVGEHVKVGNIVFQIFTPGPSLPTWHTQLHEHGPSVHNVTFFVNDVETVKQRMLGKGATEIIDTHVPFHEIGLGDGPSRLLVMDAREQTGLRFELCPTVPGWNPYPGRTDTTPPTNTGQPTAQALLHLEIVHPDPEAVLEFLSDCLGAERVEKEISTNLERAFGFGPILHAKVGNIVFQILKPPPTILGQPTSWYEELEERGAGVHNVTFYVDDVEAVKQVMVGKGATALIDMDVPFHEFGMGEAPTRLLVMDAREQTGLRFEMVQPIDGWTPYPEASERLGMSNK